MTKHKSMIRGGLAGGISAAAMACALALGSPAAAQTSAAAVEGHVDGAPAGTEVSATDTVTGRTVTGKVDAKGNYRILGLRPSTYEIKVDGKAPQQATLLVGQTTSVDFADKSSEIVVTGYRGLAEVRTATVASNITPAQIENLPQNKRNFLDFASLAPGVTVTRGGNAQVQAGGISSSNVNVLLDGMSLKNPINHGGIFGQNFGLGNPFPQIAVQEYKVETQNFGAETGQAGSAVITAVTKTGGDEFHGSAFIQFQPKSFVGQPYFDKKRGLAKPPYNRKQFGAELGGPIIPGKLTFYIAGEGTIQKLPGLSGNVTVPIPQNLEPLINTTKNNDFKQGLYFGKLTFYASDADTINLSAFIRRENNLADIDSNATPSHGRTILTHQDRYQFQWLHNTGDLLNALNISYDKGTQSTPSLGTGPEYVLSGGMDFSAVAVTGAHFFTQADNQKLITIKDDLTLPRGDHTFKFGGQVSFMDLSRSVSDHFNGSYYYVNPGAVPNFDPTTAIPYGARINTTPTPTLSAKNTQIGFYAQDEWKPDEHWTLNLGLRWDYETNPLNNKYVTPPAIAEALRAYPGWKARGINPEDYISTGNNRKAKWDMFQPRIGISYDVHGDRDLVLFAGAGRYYDRSLFIDGVIESLTNTNKTISIMLPDCASSSPPAYCRDTDALRTYAQSLGTKGGSVFVLNNNTPIPYSDQFDIGVRKRFGEIQTSLTFSYIRSHNIFQFVRANFYENGWYTRYVTRDGAGNVTGCTDGGETWIQDNSPGGLTNQDGSAVSPTVCAAQNAQLAGFSGKLNRGASGGVADYTAIYLKVEKPFTDHSTWGFTTALTIQNARTNDAQELNSDEFYNGTAQDVYGWGYVNGVEKWRLNQTAIWRAPLGITLSGNLTLSSGPAFGNIKAPWNSSIQPPDGACCYAQMGGVFYPKPFIAYKRLDLRVAKTFKMPYGGGHELTLDFQAFNVFNWLNRTYSSWGAGGGDPAPRIEDGQVGNDSRSFQAGIKYTF